MSATVYEEILNKATEVLGGRDLAEAWMLTPARGLDGRAPVEMMSTDADLELVRDFLGRMEYGVY
jgi:putative toxin-antitoxin system antitoxin component (TIGR02293 family)